MGLSTLRYMPIFSKVEALQQSVWLSGWRFSNGVSFWVVSVVRPLKELFSIFFDATVMLRTASLLPMRAAVHAHVVRGMAML